MTIKTQLIPMDKLAAAIAANSKAHAKVDQQWQVLALSAVAVFAENGNVHYVNSVYKSLGKGARHAAMTAWLIAFGGVKANEGENKDETPFIKAKDKLVDLAKAEENPWFTMKPSPEPSAEIDYLALILKAAKKPAKEGQTVKGAEFRQRVLALADEMSAASADPLSGVKGSDHDAT